MARSARGGRRGAHLVDEGGEPVVEGLDLLALLPAHLLDGGVDVHPQRGQQALVDRDLADARAPGAPPEAERTATRGRDAPRPKRLRLPKPPGRAELRRTCNPRPGKAAERELNTCEPRWMDMLAARGGGPAAHLGRAFSRPRRGWGGTR